MSVAEHPTEIPMENAKTLPIGLIESDSQSRKFFDDPGIRLLGQCMVDDGQLQPILVRWDATRRKYIIVFGERRYRAALIAGLATLNCIVQDSEMDEAEILFKQILENEHRENLKPSEQAKAFALAVELKGLTGKQLAERISVSESKVSRSLCFLDLTPEYQAMVDAGKISLVKALRLSKQKKGKGKPSAGPKVTKDSKQKKLSTSVGITLTLTSRKALVDANIIAALREILAILEAAATTPMVIE